MKRTPLHKETQNKCNEWSPPVMGSPSMPPPKEWYAASIGGPHPSRHVTLTPNQLTDQAQTYTCLGETAATSVIPQSVSKACKAPHL